MHNRLGINNAIGAFSMLLLYTFTVAVSIFSAPTAPEPESAVAVVTEFNGFTTRHRVFENMDLQNCLAFAESYSILPTENLDADYRLVTCLKGYPTGGAPE